MSNKERTLFNEAIRGLQNQKWFVALMLVTATLFGASKIKKSIQELASPVMESVKTEPISDTEEENSQNDRSEEIRAAISWLETPPSYESTEE